MTPAEALARLKDGNRAFLNDEPLQPPLDRASRLALAEGQKPFAAYVSCSDSRVPPELLFGRGWVSCSSSAMPAIRSMSLPWAVWSSQSACSACR